MENAPLRFKLPLVSVIIVNWNYGRFVGDAIASVKRQTYPEIQCIIVDNGSSDNSIAVIAASTGDDERFKIVRLEENIGHLGGAMAAFELVKGEFVTFLDADDYFFDNFVSSHVQVHLSTKKVVSFSSSNATVVDAEGAMIAGAFPSIDRTNPVFTQCLPAERPNLVEGVSLEHYRALRAVSCYGPPHIGHWFWMPGSSNVIRRELLLALKPDAGKPLPFGGVDAFFLLPLYALTGVIIVDTPLSAYRIHGDNDHSRVPVMEGLIHGNEQAYLRNTAVKKLLLLTMIERCETLVELIYPARRYFEFLGVLARNAVDSVRIARTRIFAQDDLLRALARQYKFLVSVFGEKTVLRDLRDLMRVGDLFRLLSIAFDGRVPAKTLMTASIAELRRFTRKRRGRAVR